MSVFLSRRITIRAAALAAALAIVSGCSKSPAAQRNYNFDGTRAFEVLKEQCSFGPRYPGVKGHDTIVDFIQSQLKGKADEISIHKFTGNANGKTLFMRNIYAVINSDANRFILLCAHYDTRPIADNEIDQAKRNKPIPGANDGASGVAVLLELARVFHEKKPPVGIVLAFFDGEDYSASPDGMFLGSKEFARTWKTQISPKGKRISFEYGVLLDMVGDKKLEIPIEPISYEMNPSIVDKVWAAARRAGYGDIFQDRLGYSVQDDHIPLNRIGGIRCIDVIDFNYAYWHTLDDTPDKCSAESLKAVGDVMEELIYSGQASQSRR